MTGGNQHDKAAAAQGRVVAVVIALAGLLAIIAPWLTQVLGLPLRYEFLFYLIALAGFAWGLVVTYQIWRKRQDN